MATQAQIDRLRREEEEKARLELEAQAKAAEQKRTMEESLSRPSVSDPNANIFRGQPPKITPTPEPVKPVDPSFKETRDATPVDVFRDQDTGRLTGLTKPDGTTLLGLSPKEVRAQAGFSLENTELPAGTQEALAASQARGALEEGGQLVGQVGQLGEIGELTPSVETFNRQSLLTALNQAIPTALSRTAQGALGGAVTVAAGGPIGAGGGALIGGAIGTVEGFFNAYNNNLAAQASGEISARQKTFRAAKADMRQAAMNLWSGRGEKTQILESFNIRMTDMKEAQLQLELDVSTNLNLRSGKDGTALLQQYEEFFKEGGVAEHLENEMRLALISPPSQEKALALLNLADLE